MPWNLILFESGGQTPVEDFIKSLQQAASTKLARQLDLLEEFGPRLSMPRAKPIGGGLYELRVRGKQEIRVFYIFTKHKNIYLLHGFFKKTQKIPVKELQIAIDRKQIIDNL